MFLLYVTFPGRSLLQPETAPLGGTGSAAWAGKLSGIASAVATVRVTCTRKHRIRLFTLFRGLINALPVGEFDRTDPCRLINRATNKGTQNRSNWSGSSADGF